MNLNNEPRYYLVEAGILPAVLIKVTEAKALLEAGEVSTVAEAVSRAGISRSAFYKYKDFISPFQYMKSGHMTTFHIILRNRAGALSSVLSIFAESGANILTINQSIPINGIAGVTISAVTESMSMSTEELMRGISALDGVKKIEALAG